MRVWARKWWSSIEAWRIATLGTTLLAGWSIYLNVARPNEPLFNRETGQAESALSVEVDYHFGEDGEAPGRNSVECSTGDGRDMVCRTFRKMARDTAKFADYRLDFRPGREWIARRLGESDMLPRELHYKPFTP